MPTRSLADDQSEPQVAARVAEKGQAQYWTVESGRLLVGRTLAELVGAMRRPTLSMGALSAMAGGRGGIWLSPFEGVQRLTFGHELLVTGGSVRVRRWFRPEDAAHSTEPPAEVIGRAIADAVEQATAGVREATVALSGGLDSTILLAVAAGNARLRQGLRAYCAVPDPECAVPVPGRNADEWPSASATADLVGVPVKRLVNDGWNWLDVADEIHARALGPILVAANLWWLRRLEREAARKGHRVILTGQSGNASFSHGWRARPPRVSAAGTRRIPARRQLLELLSTSGRRSQRSVLLPGISAEIPEHILDMDPWTRWCLAEPPASAAGPWTGADVVWKDPLGSPRVIAAAMSLPESAWGAKASDRALARQVGVDLIPEQVRRNDVRGIQGSDLPGMVLRHADAYRSAVRRVCDSESAQGFLDVRTLWDGQRLLRGDLKSAQVFSRRYVRPLAVGLFAAWWDERNRVSATNTRCG